ncbi:MAG: hypothetical protein LBV01_06615 [Deltaproteobacteria bacterium]|nr:hypothetical protein [Deltaproteobacteria bacterium]
MARIVYTADTLGQIHPCASCGDNAQGGLARRARLLRVLAAETPRPLILAGPNEFYADKDDGAPGDRGKTAALLREAFAAMPYAAIYFSDADAARLRQSGLALPPSGVAVGGSPVVRFFQSGAFTAGCVFLPPGDGPRGTPTPEQLAAAQQAARKAAARARLVIGIAPWGILAENARMPDLAGYFSLVLGGGPGIAVPGQATGSDAAPGPLWARADRLGRALTVLDIHSLPEGPASPWIEGLHFTSRLIPLEKELPEDEAIRALFSAGPPSP